MKKTIFKAVAAAAIAGAVIALSSIAAFAGTLVFDMDNAEGFEKQTYTGGSITKSNTTAVIFDNIIFDDDNAQSKIKITALAANVGTALITYPSDKGMLTESNGKSGALKNTVFKSALMTQGGIDGKNFVKIEGVPENATVGMYYAFVKSSGEAGSSGYVSISSNGAEAEKSESVESSSPTQPMYFSAVSKGGDIIISGNQHEGKSGSARIAITAITIESEKIKSANTAVQIGETQDYYILNNGTTYIVHALKNEDLDKYTYLALEGKNQEALASTGVVYDSVKFTDESEITASDLDAAALYTVEVTGTEGTAPTKEFNWIEGTSN